ncbi:MAG: AAA family ATPase [Akkermansiaceae bacterium]|jgi:hypothetical protein|nr:ATP-binding protein [Luteolibacter sp.]
MILKYVIQNFYSFREESVVDFTVSPQAGFRPGLVETEAGHRLNTVIGVFGANASGKTNLLKPLSFLSWFIIESARAKPGSALLCEPFAFLPPTAFKPTIISLDFVHNAGEYRYELSVLKNRVLHEALLRKKTRFSYLFERTWNDEVQDYEFKSQDIGPSAHVPLRENASWLSSALLQEHELALALRPFFDSFHCNLNFQGRMPTHDAEMVNMLRAAEFYGEQPEFLNSVSDLMAGFDLGLRKIHVEKTKSVTPDGKEVNFSLPLAVHHLDGVDYIRALYEESRGTQALFVLLRHLLPVLQSGGIAFIDELESGLHPHMVAAVIDLFFNPATNPKGAQLIATFHTDYLLRDKLHKYQIYFVEKDDRLNSTAYRLDSVKGVRNVDNIYEKYHAGAYGGIPSLP